MTQVVVVTGRGELRALATEALEGVGCEVLILAPDQSLPSEALPDLLVLDAAAQESTGWLATWMTTPLTAAAPALVVAPVDEPDALADWLNAGADDVIPEPLPPLLFRTRVTHWLEHQALKRHRDTVAQEQDLIVARSIQANFLPRKLPRLPGWEIEVAFEPALQVAGDFYDVFSLTNNRRLGLVVADVCDKGLGAALFMALVRSLIHAFARQHYSAPWDALLGGEAPARGRRAFPPVGATALKNAITLTNEYLVTTHNNARAYATLFFGVLDPATGQMLYINGGHEPPLVRRVDGTLEALPPTGPAVGLWSGGDWEIETLQLAPGDTLLVYTDGVTDARAPDRSFFEEERLRGLVAAGPGQTAPLLDGIRAELARHIGKARQADDITMLGVHRLAEANAE